MSLTVTLMAVTVTLMTLAVMREAIDPMVNGSRAHARSHLSHRDGHFRR